MAKFKSKFRTSKKGRIPDPTTKSGKMGRAFSDRKAERGSQLGRLTEDRVENLLQKKKEAGELINFKKFHPHSQEDRLGKDFWVEKLIDGTAVSATFGITTSLMCEQDHKLKHPDVPCIIIPPEMRDERIWQRICQILKDKKKEASP